MPKENPTAGQPELRQFLEAIYTSLGQPPLGWQVRATLIRCLDLLADEDLDRRFQVRERIGELLAEGDERS